MELPDNEIMNASQAVKLLGISKATLFRWNLTGEVNIPQFKIGNCRKYSRSQILEWIEKQKAVGKSIAQERRSKANAV